MSRYIDADAVIDEMSEKHRPNFHEDLKAYHMWIMWYWALKNAPSIDLADYVPKEFHDRTCEAMAKAHQKEIADMVSVVRCKECKRSYIEGQTTLYRVCGLHDITTDENNYCSWGEREGE